MREGKLCTEVQEKDMIEQNRTNGAMIFIGPVLSAKKFGMRRPKTDAAFKIERT